MHITITSSQFPLQQSAVLQRTIYTTIKHPRIQKSEVVSVSVWAFINRLASSYRSLLRSTPPPYFLPSVRLHYHCSDTTHWTIPTPNTLGRFDRHSMYVWYIASVANPTLPGPFRQGSSLAQLALGFCHSSFRFTLRWLFDLMSATVLTIPRNMNRSYAIRPILFQ